MDELIKYVGDVLDGSYKEECLDTEFYIEEKKTNRLSVVIIVLLVLTIVATLVLIVPKTIKQIALRYRDNQYLEYMDKCAESTRETEEYIIVNTIQSRNSEYHYIDTISSDYMYTEKEESNNGYILDSWSDENGTTYKMSSDSESVLWIRYPRGYNEVSLSSRCLDYQLWRDCVVNIKKATDEYIDLGLSESSLVKVYEFSINSNKVHEALDKKVNTLYLSLVDELVGTGKEYDIELAKRYDEAIEEVRSCYSFSSATGKLGIYDDRLVMLCITLKGGGDCTTYSKVVNFGRFDKRIEPDMSKEKVIELTDYVRGK